MKHPVILFFLLLSSPLWAQRSTASASVDKTSILIGEPFELTLEATFSKPHAPISFTVDSLPHFEIQNRSKIDTSASGDQTVLKQTLTLTSWDSGAWAIPSLSAGVKGVATKPIAINVTYTPTPPNQDYHDIKDIIDVPKPPRTTWYWYLAGAALLLALLLLVFPKKKREAPVAETVTAEGAYKKALRDLDALKISAVADDKEYFTTLILIFRNYLHQSKGIHSLQQTTDDLSRQLQTLSLEHGDLKKLVETLELSDFVKFAQYKTAPGERDAAWDEIRQSIRAIEQLPT